jgi:hypothetical protein
VPAAVAIGPVLDDSNSSAGNGGSYFASVELAVDADKPRYGSSFATGCCIGCTAGVVIPPAVHDCTADTAGCSAKSVDDHSRRSAGHCIDAAGQPAAADAAARSESGAAVQRGSVLHGAVSAKPAAVDFAAVGTSAAGSAAADFAVVSEPDAALHAAAGSVPAEPDAAGPTVVVVPAAAFGCPVVVEPVVVEPVVAAVVDAGHAAVLPVVSPRRVVLAAELSNPHFAALFAGRYSEWSAAAPAFFYRPAGLFVARSHQCRLQELERHQRSQRAKRFSNICIS